MKTTNGNHSFFKNMFISSMSFLFKALFFLILGLRIFFHNIKVVVVVDQFWHFIAAYELFVLFFSSVLSSCTLSHVASLRMRRIFNFLDRSPLADSSSMCRGDPATKGRPLQLFPIPNPMF